MSTAHTIDVVMWKKSAESVRPPDRYAVERPGGARRRETGSEYAVSYLTIISPRVYLYDSCMPVRSGPCDADGMCEMRALW